MVDDARTPLVATSPVAFADDGRLSPLSTPSATRAVLEAHGIGTKYTLGQNFLVNDDVLKKIIALADVQPTDRILEVGPGIGTLTIALLKHAASVVSIERDPDLPAVLADTLWPWREKFALIEKDALDVTESDIGSAMARIGGGSECADETTSAATGAASGAASPNKLVANLPYAVAATVVLDYFQQFPDVQSATVMVQKEVADRMAAAVGTKNYGAYTVKLGLYARPAGRFAVGPGNFFPPPRVDSAVIRLDRTVPLDAAGHPATPQNVLLWTRSGEAGWPLGGGVGFGSPAAGHVRACDHRPEASRRNSRPAGVSSPGSSTARRRRTAVKRRYAVVGERSAAARDAPGVSLQRAAISPLARSLAG